MKRILISIVLALLVGVATEAAVGKYETFHDSQGRELQARILSLDLQSKTVKIQLRNGKIRTADLSVFSEADQVRMREWQTKEVILSEKNLVVTINKKSEGAERRKNEVDGWTPKTSGMRVEEVAYELQLDSRNKMALKGLTVDYCIYHQSTEKGTWVEYWYQHTPSPRYDKAYEENQQINPKNNENKRSQEGTEKIPKKTIDSITTGALLIPELSKESGYAGLTKVVSLKKGSEFRPIEAKEGGYPERSFPEVAKNPTRRLHKQREVEEKVVGVIFRISLPLPSGECARKEYSYPKDLLKKKTVDWDALDAEPSNGEAKIADAG